MQDNFKVKGVVHILLKNEKGEVVEERHIPNLVVTAGRSFIASRVVGVASAVMSHMAVGTSSTAAAAGQTALVAEVGRTALSSGTATSSDVTYVASFGPGVGTGALQEAGVFNAGAAGTMLCRTTFAVVNKGAGDTLQITWTVSVV